MITIKQALAQALITLPSCLINSRLDAEILLAFILQQNRSYLYAHHEQLLSKKQTNFYEQLIAKRRIGVPVAYLTGIKEFWSMPLNVNKNTLIPRPESELLVELTLKFLSEKPKAQILELGTGSGAIAIACAYERPDWQITAIDRSRKALRIAKHNATKFNITNINFSYSNWFSKINKNLYFDVIISNPPYIAQNDMHLADLSFEPQQALISGEDGLKAIQHIIKHSLARLKDNGLLLLEHGYNQKEQIHDLFIKNKYKQINCWQDWQGHDRVSAGYKFL